MYCNLCPRMCGVCRGDQAPGEGPGLCRMGEDAVLARAALHFDEEPCISGSRGSGAVFFSGCTLGCLYCQNSDISRGCRGKAVSNERLRRIFERLAWEEEAHNLNLVTGSHFLPAILSALVEPIGVPVVWNSSGYESVEALRRLEGKVQVYLPDLKYLDSAGAARLSGAMDYPAVATAAIAEMVRQVGDVRLDEEGVMTRGVMIRHLVLPGRVQESKQVLDWIAQNLPGQVWVSLMAQYVPCGAARQLPPLDRPVTAEEYDEVTDHLMALGLEEGYVQELTAADSAFIPTFDLTGL